MINFKMITKPTIALYAMLAVVLSSCEESKDETYDRWMTELDCPIILIGKTDKAVSYPYITVRDGQGRVRTMGADGNGGFKLPGAISNSRNVGDTLKPCH